MVTSKRTRSSLRSHSVHSEEVALLQNNVQKLSETDRSHAHEQPEERMPDEYELLIARAFTLQLKNRRLYRETTLHLRHRLFQATRRQQIQLQYRLFQVIWRPQLDRYQLLQAIRRPNQRLIQTVRRPYQLLRS
jgi:hypothetical protein